jgi:hypothetical protein
MFEITRDDIAALNDEDLRTLIGLLCEAELRRANLPVSAATWGGDQTAKDGGLDLRVALPPGTKIEGFIPEGRNRFSGQEAGYAAFGNPKGNEAKGRRPAPSADEFETPRALGNQNPYFARAARRQILDPKVRKLSSLILSIL